MSSSKEKCVHLLQGEDDIHPGAVKDCASLAIVQLKLDLLWLPFKGLL